jgi:hypothetical protein
MMRLLLLVLLAGCHPVADPHPLPCEVVGPHRCTVVVHVDGER